MKESVARPAGWMITGALFFATMGAMTHALGTRCDWLFIALSRTLFMLITTVSLAWSTGTRLTILRPRTLWLRSLAGSFSLVCNFYAMTKLPVADVLTLTNTHPLWIVLLTAVLWRRRPKSIEIVGLVLGMIGVILIQRPQLGGNRLAVFIALGSAVSTAAAMLGLHRLRDLDSKAIVAHFAGVATLIAGVWAMFRRAEGSAIVLDRTTLFLLLGVGVTGTIGQLFLTKAYTSGADARGGNRPEPSCLRHDLRRRRFRPRLDAALSARFRARPRSHRSSRPLADRAGRRGNRRGFIKKPNRVGGSIDSRYKNSIKNSRFKMQGFNQD